MAAATFSRTTRALQADGARGAWWVWGLAALGLAAWGGWFVFAGVGVVEVSRQARLEVARAPHAVAAQQAGALVRSTLVIGQRVQAGDVLAELDTTGARLQLAEEAARAATVGPRLASLQAELAAQADALAADQQAAQAALQAAQARVAEARAAADFAGEQARRVAADARAGGGAEVDALRAAAEARRLAAQHDALVADARRLALDAETRQRQGRVQAQALRRAQAALDGELQASRAVQARLAQQVERFVVRAPVAGTVAEVQALAPGAWVGEGQKLATVVPEGELVVVAEFDPASALGRLRPGQRATLRLDGFPWAQYGSVPAQVQRVAGELRGSTLRVELRPEPGARVPLQHGLPGRVEVDVERTSPFALLLRAAGRPLAP